MIKEYLQWVGIQTAAVGICILGYYISLYCGIMKGHNFPEDTLAFLFTSYIFFGAAGFYVAQYEYPTRDEYFKYFKKLMVLQFCALIGFASTSLIIIKTGCVEQFVNIPFMVIYSFLTVIIYPAFLASFYWLLNKYGIN